MKVIALNGSPRKTWNTATLLQKALEGAASQGAETELIHLSDLNYKGCISCFACKLRDGKSYGRCAQNDDLTPVLAKIAAADAFILGSPNYLGAPTALTRACFERLIFPYVVYDTNMSSLFPRKISTGFIYTMGSTEAWMREMRYDQSVEFITNMMQLFFGAAESLVANDTYQFEDYAKVVAPRFDPAEKARRREQQFPKDCQKAFEMGVRLVRPRAADGQTP